MMALQTISLNSTRINTKYPRPSSGICIYLIDISYDSADIANAEWCSPYTFLL